MGRPRININWDEFDKLVSFQCTQIEIAAFFDVSVDLLEDACIRDRGHTLAEIWAKKTNMGRVRLRKIQFDIAESRGPGAATMAIFLGKRILGQVDVLPEPPKPAVEIVPEIPKTKSFNQFCIDAGYPEPFEKQIEMMKFGFHQSDPRLILGSRGYGKTDYITILGTAYDVYVDYMNHVESLKTEKIIPISSTNLIISKSKTRNTAMIEEIAKALKANGVELEKENSSCIRVSGLIGKDHSIETITIRSSMRGRHPKRTLMDDPVTDEDVSQATRTLVKRRFDEVMKLCPNVLVIGQPAHKHDLYASLRQLVKKLEVPHGTIPQLDHDLEAQRLAGVDENSIQASYFLKIISEGTIPFDKIKYVDKYPMGDSSIAFIDPSHEGGDYTALTIMKSYMGGIVVIGRVWKMAWNHCLDDMVKNIAKYGVKKLAFESNALGDQPIIMLRDLLGPHGVGVVGRRSNTNKHARIMAAGAYSHLIHLAKESDKIYTDQVIEYEYKAKNDDAPDSLASCMEWVGLIRGKM